MDRARIKTFVLLLLLAVNVTFLALIATDWVQTSRLRSEARAELTNALDRMGITLAYEALPDEEGPQPISFLRRETDTERQVAAVLLGDPEERDEGGGIYHYQSESGQTQFRGGTFWALFTDLVHRVEDAGELMARMGFRNWRGHGDDTQITYTLAVEGRPVVNGQVTFHFADGYMLEIHGTALWGSRRSYAAQGQQDVATALIALAGHLHDGGAVSRFERVEMGYYLLEGPGYLELRPVWVVETDAGIFSIDRQSGEIRG